MEAYVVAPDDPRRCQGTTPHGQCPLEALPYKQFCHVHIRLSAVGHRNEQEQSKFRLRKWQARVDEFAIHPEAKTLQDEIGILRMLLEEIINSCNDSTMLVLNSHKISDIVTRIEKLVSSCHKLERATGALLDKNTIMMFITRLIEVIGTHVKDPAALQSIGDVIVCEFKTIQALQTTAIELKE